MTTKIRVSPEQQIQNIIDALAETESSLQRKGIDTYLLRTWLNQELLLRELQDEHERGELAAIEINQEDYY